MALTPEQKTLDKVVLIFRCIEGPFVETSSHIDEYALVGLRTLAIASRELSQRQYESFVQKLNTASQSLEERERKTRVRLSY